MPAKQPHPSSAPCFGIPEGSGSNYLLFSIWRIADNLPMTNERRAVATAGAGLAKAAAPSVSASAKHVLTLQVRPSAMKKLLIACVFAAGCSSSPTAPTPPPVIVTQPPAVVVAPPVVTPPVVSTPTANPLLSDPRFSLSFYRALVLNAYELPSMFALRRWTRPPFIYMRTVDDQNRAISASLLDQTAAAVINTTSQFTGGAFGVAGLERGTGTRAGQAQWITIEWSTTGACGETTPIGTEGSVIVMNARRSECTCGGLVARHELGHALGYYHTDSPNDVMFGGSFSASQCDLGLSAREIFHMRVAYSQAIGSLDPR